MLNRRSPPWRRDTRGAIAMITAIVLLPLLFFCVAIPIDLARQVQLRSSLQNIADAAALAGSAALGVGASGAQACALANAYVQAGTATGLSVPFSALAPAGAFAATAAFIPPATTTPLGCPATAPNVTSLAAAEATTPFKMTVTIAADLPTTFLAFYRKSLAVSVTAVAVGPTGFINACITPNPTVSADLNALYYYVVYPDGSFHNADYSALNKSVGAPAAQKLTDNVSPTGFNYVAKGICNGANSYTNLIALALGQRVGFEFDNQTGGQYPCYYASTYNDAGNKLGLTGNYAGGATSFSCLSAGTGYTAATALTNFYTTAYGAMIGTINRFYSTDYPADLNTTADGSTGDYSAANQAQQINTLYPHNASTSDPLYNGVPGSNVTYFNSTANFLSNGLPAPSTADLVCLVQNGLAVAPLATKTVTLPGGSSFTNASAPLAQQQNLIIANSKLGATTYRCATATAGDPYNVDPTCNELNGATLNVAWNDMGGRQNDNVGYQDLTYRFSCSAGTGVPTLDYTRPALIQ